MTDTVEWISGADTACLIVCEHASNRVPDGISLGVPDWVMQTHIAVDIGAADVSRALAKRLGCSAHLATVSRLVADFNRAGDSAELTPIMSDGIQIPGNAALSDRERAKREALHRAYHESLASVVAATAPKLLISLHSFTPSLMATPTRRPWPIGVLWNQDERAAIPGLDALRREALQLKLGPVGANEPYSGTELNYAMDRHGEATGIPYLGLEIRQDEISDRAGVEKWAAIVERAVRHVQRVIG